MGPDDEKTLTIARRTKKNLDYIYKAKDQGGDVEEFTQLLNSMLGMIICLREEYFKDKQVTWDDVASLGLPKINITDRDSTEKKPNLKKVNSFSQLITKVRHAFAHNCFSIETDGKSNQIKGITVWNIPSGQEKTPQHRTWEAYLSEDKLKQLAYLFIDFIEAELGKNTR